MHQMLRKKFKEDSMAISVDTVGAQLEVDRAVREGTADAISDLEVLIQHDRVLISGIASSYYVKQLATQAALAASGGLAVCNEIYVKGI